MESTVENKKRKRNLLSRRENEFLSKNRNILDQSYRFKGVFDDETISLLKKFIIKEGAYTVNIVLKDKHFHKAIINRIGNSFRIFLLDDESTQDKPEGFTTIEAIIDENHITSIQSVVSNNPKFQNNYQINKDKSIRFIAKFLKILSKDISFTLEPTEEKLSNMRKPFATKLIDPDGSVQTSYKIPKEEFAEYVLKRNLSKKKRLTKE